MAIGAAIASATPNTAALVKRFMITLQLRVGDGKPGPAR
jgi:hypothetical protein